MLFKNEYTPIASTVALVSQFVVLIGMPLLGVAYWPDEVLLPEGWAPAEGAAVGLVAAILTLMKVNDIGTNNPDFGSSNYDK